MLQRVMIAGALAADPDLLIADEPTTALDVTTQAEIMAILARLRRERHLTMIFITHDLEVASALCDRVVVMYAGSVAETGARAEVFHAPKHPYTHGLLKARPTFGDVPGQLTVIPGHPVSGLEAPGGCPFHGRCAWKREQCTGTGRFQPMNLGGGRTSSCIRIFEIEDELVV
jgi:oligopeptide/dipeptide ABC transporter ATP-binding protein